MLLQDVALHWCLHGSKLLMPIRASKGPPSHTCCRLAWQRSHQLLRQAAPQPDSEKYYKCLTPRELISTVPQCPPSDGVWACYFRGVDVPQSPDSRHTKGHHSWRNPEPGAGRPAWSWGTSEFFMAYQGSLLRILWEFSAVALPLRPPDSSVLFSQPEQHQKLEELQ